MPLSRVSVVIPTFNEPDLLRKTVDSLSAGPGIELRIVVANAGEALPDDLSARVSEVRIGSENFWTGSMEAGLEWVRQDDSDYVMFLNADTSLLPGTIEKEIAFVGERQDVVACCPAYTLRPDGSLELLYSHQSDWGILLMGKLIRPWTTPSEAATEPFLADLHGGQGTLFRRELLDRFSLDTRNFPHYTADHDFWLTLREAGIRLWVVPQAGVVNERDFGAHQKKSLGQRLRGLKRRFSSPMMGESAPAMWRLRAKHLPVPLAIVSFVVAFGMRWTLGLPNIIRRL